MGEWKGVEEGGQERDGGRTGKGRREDRGETEGGQGRDGGRTGKGRREDREGTEGGQGRDEFAPSTQLYDRS